MPCPGSSDRLDRSLLDITTSDLNRINMVYLDRGTAPTPRAKLRDDERSVTHNISDRTIGWRPSSYLRFDSIDSMGTCCVLCT